MAPSPVAGIVYVSPDGFGRWVVGGTRTHRLPSLAEALAWCDDLGLQVLNRDELARQLAERVTSPSTTR